MTYRVESLISARLFVVPQYAAGRIFFLSNQSGQLSLYSMKFGGSVPEPLLPPNIALQNPHLIGGLSFFVFPKVNKILVMIDQDGDENYQPMLIPIQGGFPEPAFKNFFAKYRVHLGECDAEKNIVYLDAERRDTALIETYRGDLKTGKLTKIAESEFGLDVAAHNKKHARLLLNTGYTVGDGILYLWSGKKNKVLYGKPLEDRTEGESIPLNGLGSAVFSPSEKGALVISSVFEDTYGLGYIDLRKPGRMEQVQLRGVQHEGVGEMVELAHLIKDRYLVTFNIDGCSWVYEAVFNERKRLMTLKYALVGASPLADGMLERVHYDPAEDIFTLSFSTATSPTQIYTVEGRKRKQVTLHTNEKILGIADEHLSKGE
ncbi:MAG: S9 family peptidase, partial [Chloroflexota bacterium]|nr:S9 family peptidase [Chloroflexota bacterium]